MSERVRCDIAGSDDGIALATGERASGLPGLVLSGLPRTISKTDDNDIDDDDPVGHKHVVGPDDHDRVKHFDYALDIGATRCDGAVQDVGAVVDEAADERKPSKYRGRHDSGVESSPFEGVVPPLPLDVVERIFLSLIEAQDDSDTSHYATLRSCCVVCRAWSGIANKVLLKRVMVDTAEAYDRFVRRDEQSEDNRSIDGRELERLTVDTLFVRNVHRNDKLERLLDRIRGLRQLIVSVEEVEDDGIDIPSHLSSLRTLVILHLSPFQIRPPPTTPVTPVRLTSFRYVVGQISPLWIYRILEASRDTIKSFDVEFPDDLTEGDCVEGWLPFLPLFESITIRNPQEYLARHFDQCASLKRIAFDLDYDDASDIQPILAAIPDRQLESFAILASTKSDEEELLIESSRWIMNERSLSNIKRVRYPASSSSEDGSSIARSPSWKTEMANDFYEFLTNEKGVDVVFEPNREYYS